MQEILSESVRDKIVFGCSIDDIKKNGNQAELFDKDNNSLGYFDLVIDASGSSSVLRNKKSKRQSKDNFSQYYYGFTIVRGVINDPEVSCDPLISQKLGQGKIISHFSGRRFELQRFGTDINDHRTSLNYMISCSNINELHDKFNLPRDSNFHDSVEILNIIKQWMLDDYRNCPADYTSAILAMDKISISSLLQHPMKPKFLENDLPLLIIGDALHTVPCYFSTSDLSIVDAFDSYKKIKGQNSFTIKSLECKLLSRAIPHMKKSLKFRRAYLEIEKYYEKYSTDLGILHGTSLLSRLVIYLFTQIYKLEKLLSIRND